MTPEQFRKVREVFHQVCGMEVAERAAFLDQACAGDARLRGCVEALLKQDGDQDGPLTGSMVDLGQRVLATTLVDQESCPERIGQYRILRQIGSGGMGVVYAAEQERPRRSVALKLIRPELASTTMRRRFELEAEVLGRLRHAGIAQIFEAGSVDLGHGPQPFIALELVEGPTLTAYAEQRRLGVRERLDLFVRVADAVYHAHQRGVIHRDLKPANILVIDEDGAHQTKERGAAPPSPGSAQPKILDFGIARSLDPDHLSVTVQTAVGQLIGTLPYMSPEQVTGGSSEIDTRSDVYALGVLLYELLTGKLPYALSNRALPEVARIIREDMPVPLSAHGRELRGDLDTIVRRALEKDAHRRYQSAADLAADIRRYLKGEVIDARRDSTWYVLKKTVRRHRLPFAAGVALAVVLMASTVIAWALRAQAQGALYDSLLAQAKATRRTGQQGQRFDALDAVRRAAAIHRSLALRNEAIAAMALSDIRPVETPAASFGGLGAAFDRDLERCAVVVEDRSSTILRIRDGAELAVLPPIVPVRQGGQHILRDEHLLRAFWDGPEQRWLEVWRLPPAACAAAASHPYRPSPESGEPTRVLEFANLPYQGGFDVSADERFLAVSLDDSAIHIFDLQTYEEVRRLELESDPKYLKFDPEGRRIAVFHGEFASKACMVDVASGERTPVFEGMNIQWSVDWSPDGRRLAGADGWTVQLWDLDRRRSLGSLPVVHNHAVTSVRFGPGGDILLTKGWDGAPILWDTRLFAPLLRVHGRFWDFGPSHMSADGRWLAGSDSDDGWTWRPTLYEFVHGEECFTLVPHSTQTAAGGTSAFTLGQFSADGRLLFFFAGEDEPVSGWYVFDAALRRELAWVPTQGPGQVVLDPAGQFVLVGARNGLWLWPMAREGDVIRLGPPRCLYGRPNINRLALGPSGQVALVEGFQPGTLLMLDPAQPQNVQKLGEVNWRADVRFSADGRYLAGYGEESGTTIWDLQTGRIAAELPVRGLWSLFGADGRRLFTSDAHELCVWEVGTWARLECMPAASDRIAGSRDGRMLAARTGMSRMRLLRTDTLEELATLEYPGMAPHSFVFSPDGAAVAAFMARNLATVVWDLRRIRAQLAEMGLDWTLPPYPPAESVTAMPLRLQIDAGGETN